MTTEPTTTPPQAPPPAWGDPQPPAPKWSGRKTAIAAVVAVVIAAIGGVAIYLGTQSSASGQQGFGGQGGFNRMGGMGGSASLLTQALHGDFTVSENGGYVTERLQSGSVTALDATSVTVKSKDGYTQTYAIDSSTQKASNVATGTSVEVIAKVSGDKATATTITDASQTSRSGGQQGGFPGGSQQGGFPGGGQQGGFPGGGQMPGQQGGSTN
ncbi:hypothetical protein FHX82_002271 [Amycolatopsis bartoniae]|uniref:DUF5666 domain-containing protein n=1 Tax=Amycolatopsis bartoniae TaxID=941986 RepID=A0A8H9IZY1_9PSEU|nr:hypothetical protein [Amycolatopsis bartoniae]MBB2935251.1 hypothetical protein [Amycolatopsis bartoniae]TVT04043.1 hypothetical protein FNH07_24455 [Amycolatopsis bartoniae]GHF75399.1 hypothetical protein GCM10017566_56710 [Amycolatopsis bartoniae]